MTSLTMLEVRKDMLISTIESQNVQLQDSTNNSTTPYTPNISSCVDNQTLFKVYNLVYNEDEYEYDKIAFDSSKNFTEV